MEEKQNNYQCHALEMGKDVLTPSHTIGNDAVITLPLQAKERTTIIVKNTADGKLHIKKVYRSKRILNKSEAIMYIRFRNKWVSEQYYCKIFNW